MANITLSLSDDVKKEMALYDEVKWSEVAKKAIIEKVRQLRKLEILRKYLDREQFSKSDVAWMEENDWHPVDERELRENFVKETVAVQKQRGKKISAGALLE